MGNFLGGPHILYILYMYINALRILMLGCCVSLHSLVRPSMDWIEHQGLGIV